MIEQFHISLAEALIHLFAAAFSLFSLIRRWGFYWVFPLLASTAFFADAWFAMMSASQSEIALEGELLIRSFVPAVGALFWLAALAVLHYQLVRKKYSDYARKLHLEAEEDADDPTGKEMR